MKLQKDLALAYDDVLLVPQYSEIKHRSDVDLSGSLRNIKFLNPIWSANMDTVTESKMAASLAKFGGLGVIHRFLTTEQQVKEVSTVKNAGLIVGAAVGVKDGEQDRARALVAAGTDVLVLDIAHGHTKMACDMLKFLKKTFPKTPVVAGNVATPEAFLFLAKSGADAVKVGIGSGSVCTTRVVTGSGVPALTSIMRCAPLSRKLKVPIIGDGGIKNSGDMVKALAAGASIVMLGNLLAGTDESPGKTITVKGEKYKEYRGMASFAASSHRPDKTNRQHQTPEGVSRYVPYKGSALKVLDELIGGVESGLTYSGARTIRELQDKAQFIVVSSVGVKENGAHDVVEINK